MHKIHISMTFLGVWTLILLFDREKIGLWFLAAACVHELGHLAAIKLCGGQILQFRLGALGGVIRYYLPRRTTGKEVAVCLGGCLAGILVSGTANCFSLYLFCGASNILTIFNLLPISYLDGGRALYLMFGECRILRLIEFFTVSLMLCGGLAAAIRWHAYGLLIMGAVPAIIQQSYLHRRKKRGMI